MANKVKGRTVREFQSAENIWGIVEAWAAQTGYNLVEQDKTSRTHRRWLPAEFAFPSQMLKMTHTGQGYRMEAWLKTNIFYLGLKSPEFRIESGGLWRLAQRNKPRKQVNVLLQMLDQPPIL